MTDSESTDPAFVDAVARRIVEVLREEGVLRREGPRLLTVGEVAVEFGLSTDWLYTHARQLGAIRLGSGPKARVRFDRHTIGENIARLGSRDRHDESRGQSPDPDRTQSPHSSGLLPIADRSA